MADVERQSRLVGQRLQLDFPQPNPRPVRTSAIGRDRQLRRVGITLPPHALQQRIEATANKIEHRLFCHITQNWRGRPLTDRLAVVELIGAATTKTGLTVKCASASASNLAIGDSLAVGAGAALGVPTIAGVSWSSCFKHDGFRLLARKEGHRVTLWSRSDFTRREIAAARADFLVVERDGVEPEISLAVLPNTQSELPFG